MKEPISKYSLPKNTASLLGVFLISTLMVGGSFLLLWKIGHEPFQDYDESTYAEVATESLTSQTFLTFTFLSRPYFNKPPLLFWIMDGSMSTLKNQEVAARLPSALSGIILLGMLALFGYVATKNRYTAAVAIVVLATTSAFIEAARQARFDILVSLFIVMSVYSFFRALTDKKQNSYWFLVLGIGIAGTILSKGPLVIYALAGIVGLICVYRNVFWLRSVNFWLGVMLMALIVIPWHAYETILFGKTFWNTYVFNQVVARVQQNLFTIGPTNAEYVHYFLAFAAPWSYVFVGAVIYSFFTWKKYNAEQQAVLASSLLAIVAVFIVCFVTKTKAFSYLLPLYPFLALFCAVAITQLYALQKRVIRIVIACLVIVGGIYGLYLSIYNGFHINGYYAAEVALAENEKHIGEILYAAHTPTLYTYDVTTLGSIQYYSRILQPLQLIEASNLPNGTYVLYPTKEYSRAKSLSTTGKLVPIYVSTILSMGKVESY